MIEIKRINFRGNPAIRGSCKCGKVLIIEQPSSTNGNKYRSYHETPTCKEYNEIASKMDPEGYGILDKKELG